MPTYFKERKNKQEYLRMYFNSIIIISYNVI